MLAIEAVAVWIDVLAVEFQAQPVPRRTPSELDHQTITTRGSAASASAQVSVDAARAATSYGPLIEAQLRPFTAVTVR
jgi:hypothetical protein